MHVYLLKTCGDSTFYDNQLHFDTEEGFWMFVDLSLHCSCCGQMFVSDGSNGKLLSCAVCKVTHYCDRACWKRDWKKGHKTVCLPTKGKEGIEVVMNICIRALTIMRFFIEVEDETGSSKYMNENVMSSIFLQKTDLRPQTYVDLANDEWGTGGVFDSVCNHLRETDALVESFKTTMSTNGNTYFVLVMGMVHGKLAVVGGNSFIVIPDMPQELCPPPLFLFL